MGQKIVGSKTTLDIDYFLLNFYPQLEKIKIINNGLLYKTILVNSKYDKAPLIIKIFPKTDFNPDLFNVVCAVLSFIKFTNKM